MIRRGSVAYRRASTTWNYKVRDRFDKAYRSFIARAEASASSLKIPFVSTGKEFDGGVLYFRGHK